MIAIFDKKTIFSCIVAILFKGTNYKVLITSPSESFLLKLLKRLGFKVNIKSLIYLDMCLQNIKDTGLLDGDLNKISNKCVADLYEKIDKSKDLINFSPKSKT